MGTPISPLADQDRKKLDSIVGQMIQNNESEDNIRSVVDDFKSKYSVKKKEIGGTTQLAPPASTGLENFIPSLKESQNFGLESTGQKTENPNYAQEASKIHPGELTIGYKTSDAPTGYDEGKPTKAAKTTAGVYNTLVESAARLVGGTVKVAQDLRDVYTPGIPKGVFPDLRKPATELVEKLRSGVSTKEEERQMAEFDVKNKTFGQNVKSLLFSAPSMIADVAAGIETGGATFILQGVNDAAEEIDNNPEAKNMPEELKLGYQYTSGLINAALMRFNFDKVLKGTGVDKLITKNITDKVIKGFIDKGVKATAEEINSAVNKEVSSLATKVQKVGLKSAVGALTGGATGATMAATHGGLQKLINLKEGKEIFDTKNIGNDILNSAANLALFSGATGGGAELMRKEKPIQEQQSELHAAVQEAPENINTAGFKEALKSNDQPAIEQGLKDISQQLNSGKDAREATIRQFGEKLTNLAEQKYPNEKVEVTSEEAKKHINEEQITQEPNQPIEQVTPKEEVGAMGETKKVEQPTEKKSVLERPIEEVTIDDILKELQGDKEGLAFKNVTNKDISGGDAKDIESYNQRAENVLKTLYPNAEFKPLETNKEYEQATGRKNEAGVLIRGKEGKHQLFLNLEAIKNNKIERTATHEVIHALVSDAIGVEYTELNKKWEELWPKLAGVKGFETVRDHLQNYSFADRPVEGITDVLANVVHNKIRIEDVPKNLWDEFIELINKTFKAVGIDYKITPDTFNGFASSVKEAFDTGNLKHLQKFVAKGKTEKFFKEHPEYAEASAMVDPAKRKQLQELLSRKLEQEVKSGKLSEEDARKILEKVAPKEEEKPKVRVSAEQMEAAQPKVEPKVGKPPTEGEGLPELKTTSPLVHTQYPPTSLEYMGTGKLEAKFGIEERQPTETKHDIYTIKEADNLLEKGWDVRKELNKVDSGEKTFISDAEYINFTRYAAELSDRLRDIKDRKSPQYDETLKELSGVANAANMAGKDTARALGIRARFSTVAEGSYGEFMLNEMAANNDAPLTGKQKETANAEFDKLDVARKKLDADTKAFEEKVAAFRAEQELNKTKKAATGKKRTHEVLVKEREDILKSIGEKWKDAGKDILSSDIPYRKQISAIAPDVLKLARNLVEDGILKLEEVVKNIHGTLKDNTNLTEKDIHDIIAGEYNEKKVTKREAAIQFENLRQKAALINKLQNAIYGKPKTEKAEIKKNQEIEQFKKELGIDKLEQLESLQKRNETETKKIKELIAKGDFAPQVKKPSLMEDKEVQNKFPEQFKATRKSVDEYIKVKREIALRRLKQMHENKAPEERVIDIFSKTLNVPRTLMASFDFSAPFRQGIIATIAHPEISGGALKFMFEATKDEKAYNRWLENVHNDPLWPVAEKTGLGITDPESLHVKGKEEAFQGAPYAEKIPIVGLGVKASERAYIGYLNKIRWDLFNMYAEGFMDKGKTFENNPKLYEGLSSFINSETGRGGMKGLENAAPVFNWFLFASKLIASRLNMLGLSDIPNLAIRGATFGKYGIDYGFYTRLPKELRIEAAKDMAKFLALGVSTLIIAKALGADTENDPRSSDFGKIKVGNTRWDIWGGFQPYARVMSQVISGERKTTTKGEIQELNGKGFMQQNRFTPLGSFARGKLAPVPATVLDLATGRDASGQPVTVQSELLSDVTPLLIQDTYSAMKDQGVRALFSVGIPSAFGVGVQTYQPRETKSKAFKIYSTDGKVTEATPEQIKKYEQKRAEIESKELNRYKTGRSLVPFDRFDEINLDNKVSAKKQKLYKNLTQEQKDDLLKKIKSGSDDKAKNELRYYTKKQVQ